MADLTDEQKLELVEALACFGEPATIAREFQEAHGIEIDRLQVGRYDPTRSYYAGGDKWRTIFEARRKAYLEDVATVPAANQGYRLQMLQKGIAAAEKQRNWVLVAALLEQAAKETGGLLTNERNLRVDDRRPARLADMSREERVEAITEVIRQALESRQAAQATIEGTAVRVG
jgi:hypothetical protein